MRERLPSARSALLGFALASLIAGAPAAWAFRDGGCFLRFRPPMPPTVFGGVVMPGHDAAEAVAMAERLGLGTVSCRDPNGWWLEGVQLGPTALSWRIYGFGDRLLGLPTTGVTPLLDEQKDWGCPWFNPMNAEQPAGARQVTCAIAVVSDLDAACDAEVYNSSWRGSVHLSFGRAFDIPWLGARAREVRLQNGSLRLIEPVDPVGLAARWLADGGPRWLGLTLEVADLALAARTLERRGVKFLRASDRRHAPLIVEPDQTDGTLVEFVQASPS